MNINITKALVNIAKAESLLYAYEEVYLGTFTDPAKADIADRAEAMLLAVYDAVRSVADDLNALDADQTVVDAIYAVNDVRRTLKTKD